MKARVVVLSVLAGLVLVALGMAAWHQIDRPGLIGALCEAGLPNLSRPASVRADLLGCAVLGRRETLSGLLSTGFETADFSPDGEPERGAWFSGTETFMARGGNNVRVATAQTARLTCGVGIAKIRVEGWMTVSPGQYGHLGISPRQFYADRVLDARPATIEQVEALWPTIADVMRSGGCDEQGRPVSMEGTRP